MNKKYRRLVAVRNEISLTDPTLSLDILDSCGDPDTPCLHLILPTAVECYFVWGNQWLVKNLLHPNESSAEIGVHKRTNPKLVALSVIAESVMHELEASTRPAGAMGHTEPDAAALNVVTARFEILERFAETQQLSDPETQAHAQKLVVHVGPFVEALLQSVSTNH